MRPRLCTHDRECRGLAIKILSPKPIDEMNERKSITKLTSRLGFAAAGTALLLTGCKLPPAVAWRSIQTRGLIPTLFNTDGQGGQAKPEAGSRVVKVDPVMTPKVVDVPLGEPVPGRAGYVYSPHTTPKKIVDVRDFRSGEEVRCPITFKPFLVPDFSQPASQVAADTSAPATTPQLVSADLSAGLDRIQLNPDTPATKTGPAKEEFNSAPKLDAPKSNPPSTPTPAQSGDLPQGRRVPGRPGFVYSPYASQYQLVDVAGIAPGVEVKCPYTGKLFRVPSPLPEETGAKPSVPSQPAPTSQPKPADKPQDKPKVEEKPKPSAPAPTVGEKKQEQPKESPKPAPSVADQPKEKKEEPKPAPTTEAPKPENLPTASWAQKDKGLVQSPYGQPGQLVDVTGRTPGSKVTCPFTGKAFIVPAE